MNGVTVLISLVVLMSVVEVTESHCCAWCGWFECCPDQPCNIFCCNCDGPCHTPLFKSKFTGVGKYPQSSLDAKQRFGSIDRDHNGKIDVEETALYFGKDGDREQVHALFSKMDKDGSGFIEPKDFDKSLA